MDQPQGKGSSSSSSSTTTYNPFAPRKGKQADPPSSSSSSKPPPQKQPPQTSSLPPKDVKQASHNNNHPNNHNNNNHVSSNSEHQGPHSSHLPVPSNTHQNHKLPSTKPPLNIRSEAPKKTFSITYPSPNPNPNPPTLTAPHPPPQNTTTKTRPASSPNSSPSAQPKNPFSNKSSSHGHPPPVSTTTTTTTTTASNTSTNKSQPNSTSSKPAPTSGPTKPVLSVKDSAPPTTSQPQPDDGKFDDHGDNKARKLAAMFESRATHQKPPPQQLQGKPLAPQTAPTIVNDSAPQNETHPVPKNPGSHHSETAPHRPPSTTQPSTTQSKPLRPVGGRPQLSLPNDTESTGSRRSDTSSSSASRNRSRSPRPTEQRGSSPRQSPKQGERRLQAPVSANFSRPASRSPRPSPEPLKKRIQELQQPSKTASPGPGPKVNPPLKHVPEIKPETVVKPSVDADPRPAFPPPSLPVSPPLSEPNSLPQESSNNDISSDQTAAQLRIPKRIAPPPPAVPPFRPSTIAKNLNVQAPPQPANPNQAPTIVPTPATLPSVDRSRPSSTRSSVVSDDNLFQQTTFPLTKPEQPDSNEGRKFQGVADLLDKFEKKRTPRGSMSSEPNKGPEELQPAIRRKSIGDNALNGPQEGNSSPSSTVHRLSSMFEPQPGDTVLTVVGGGNTSRRGSLATLSIPEGATFPRNLSDSTSPASQLQAPDSNRNSILMRSESFNVLSAGSHLSLPQKGNHAVLSRKPFSSLQVIARQMRTHVEVKDRKQYLRKLKLCFVGKEALAWICREKHALNESEGIALLNQMISFNMIVHATESEKKQLNSTSAQGYFRWLDEQFWRESDLSQHDPLSITPISPLSPVIQSPLSPVLSPADTDRRESFRAHKSISNVHTAPSLSRSDSIVSLDSLDGDSPRSGSLSEGTGNIINGHVFSKSMFKSPICSMCKGMSLAHGPKLCKKCGNSIHVKCAAQGPPCTGDRPIKDKKRISRSRSSHEMISGLRGSDVASQDNSVSSFSNMDHAPTSPLARNVKEALPLDTSSSLTSESYHFNNDTIYADVDEVSPTRRAAPVITVSSTPRSQSLSSNREGGTLPPPPSTAAPPPPLPATSLTSKGTNSGNKGNGNNPGSLPPPLPQRLYQSSISNRGSDVSNNSDKKLISVTKAGYDDEDIYESLGANPTSPVTTVASTKDPEYATIDPNMSLNEQDDSYQFISAKYNSRMKSVRGIRLALSDRSPVIPPLPEFLEKSAEKDKATSPSEASPAIPKPNLWQARDDVISAGILSSMEKKAIKRQEALFELIYSEAAFLTDMRVLLYVFLLPMDAHTRVALFKNTQTLLDPKTIETAVSRARTIENVCSDLHNALIARQKENLVVSSVADIFIDFEERLLTIFSEYCETSIELRSELEHRTPELELFLKERATDKKAKGLTVDAFLLVPIQRIARYPLLLGAVLKETEPEHPDFSILEDATQRMQHVVSTCNERMRSVEDQAYMVELAAQLDWSRLEEPVELVDGLRCVQKKGNLDLVTIISKKISKSKQVFFVLFTDYLLYAKPVDSKKTGGKKFVVYKIIHRSLIETRDFANVATKNEKESISNVVEIVLYGEPTTSIYVRAASSTDKQRWVEAINPVKESEDIYFSWDCPKAKVLYDYDGRNNDELSLRVGEIVNINSRGDDWSKGFVAGRSPGWFPTMYVEEVDSQHTQANKLKEDHRRRLGSIPRDVSNSYASKSTLFSTGTLSSSQLENSIGSGNSVMLVSYSIPQGGYGDVDA